LFRNAIIGVLFLLVLTTANFGTSLSATFGLPFAREALAPRILNSN